jgi:hypothetical protein
MSTKLDDSCSNFNQTSDIIIKQISDTIDNLKKLIQEPTFEYKEHCKFIREQVDDITSNAIIRINESKTQILNDVDIYEHNCGQIALEQLNKKAYLQSVIDKNQQKLNEFQNIIRKDLEKCEKSLDTLKDNN